MSPRKLAVSIIGSVGLAVVFLGLGSLYVRHLGSATHCDQQASSGCVSPTPLVLIVIGQGMTPTLRDGQSILVDTRAYLVGSPKRGDLVAFFATGPPTQQLVRRVIALPGDQIRIVKGVVYINGLVLSEPYLTQPWTFDTTWPANGSTALVPPHKYFVLGDNRDHSPDSRSFGFVDFQSITGKAPAIGPSAGTLVTPNG